MKLGALGRGHFAQIVRTFRICCPQDIAPGQVSSEPGGTDRGIANPQEYAAETEAMGGTIIEQQGWWYLSKKFAR